MTDGEYKVALQQAQTFIKLHVRNFPDAGAIGVISDCQFYKGNTALIPRTMKVVQREALVRIARTQDDKKIDQLANSFGALRLLLDKDAKKSLLQDRFPVARRKQLYAQFAETTGDKREWSLLHPFDDLTGQMMVDVVDYCKLAKSDGLGSLDREQRSLILRAGAVDLFERLIK